MPAMLSRLFLPVLHFSFLLTGIATTMMGVLLPWLITHWSISDAQAGSLFSAQFVSSFLGSLAYGWIARRLGNKHTAILGLTILAVGVFGLAVTAWPLPLALVATYGFGLGIALPATNLLVAALSGERRAAALNLLNFSWTLGAVTSPLLFVFLLQRRHLSLWFALTTFAAVVLASAVLLSLCEAPSAASSSIDEPTSPGHPAILTWVLTGLLLFLYVGIENGVPGWAPLFGLRQHLLSETSVAFALALYWGALLLGRLAASFLWRNATPRTVISYSLGTAFTGVLLIAAGSSSLTLYLGLALTGAGLAAVFPTVVAVFSTQATGKLKPVAGILFAAAGLGGAGLPYLIGLLSSHGYGLRAGLWITAAAALAMLLIEQRISTAPLRRAETLPPKYRSAEAS